MSLEKTLATIKFLRNNQEGQVPSSLKSTIKDYITFLNDALYSIGWNVYYTIGVDDAKGYYFYDGYHKDYLHKNPYRPYRTLKNAFDYQLTMIKIDAKNSIEKNEYEHKYNTLIQSMTNEQKELLEYVLQHHETCDM